MKIRQIILATAVAMGCFAASQASADQLFMGVPETGTAYTQFGNDGILFTPTVGMWVTALDYYVSPQTSPDPYTLNAAHGVGIYDATNQALLVSATVGPCDPTAACNLVGGNTSYFASTAVAGTWLDAGHQYMLAGYSDPAELENGGDPYGAGIPLANISFYDATVQGYFYDYNGSLDYPTTPYATAFIGPNFETPEPVTLSVFGLGLAGAAALRRRKKKIA